MAKNHKRYNHYHYNNYKKMRNNENQRAKGRVFAWLRCAALLLLLFAFGGIIGNIFGNDSEVAKFYNEKILFTPYNIAGIIMLALALCGVWLGRGKGGKLKSLINSLLLIFTIIPWIMSFSQWIGLPIDTISSSDAIKEIAKIFQVIGVILISLLCIIVIALITCWIIKIISERKKGFNGNSRKSFSTAQNNGFLNMQQKEKHSGDKVISFNVLTNDNIQNKEILKDKESSVAVIKEKRIEEGILKQKSIIDTDYSKSILDYNSKIARKICPECGGRLKSRQNALTQKWFMGCEEFFTSRECKFTIDYSEFKRIEEMESK